MVQLIETVNLERYESYKDSGLQWIRDIPSTWNQKKLKYFGKVYAGISGKKGDDFSREPNELQNPKSFIPFTNICNNYIIDKKDVQYVNIKESEHQNIVKRGDLLFLMSSETLDDIGKCSIYLGEEELYLNSFCKGFRFSKNEINPLFINYLLSANVYRKYFSIVGRGFTRINIKQDYVNSVTILVPQPSEQTAIANFLDRKTAQIDKAIAQKEKLIELLKERKQIIIQNAVTRGLNPDVKMKYSGLEWIVEIPEHWEVVSNRSLFEERNEPGEGGIPLLTVSIHTAVSSEELDAEDNIQGRIKIENKSSYKLVEINDITFNMMRAWQGAIGAVRVRGMVSPAYIVAKPKGRINSDFFEYQHRTASAIKQIERHSKGISDFRKRLYWNEFKQLKTVLPPMTEQLEIVKFIKCINKTTERAINLQEKQIEKLKEYKATLVDSAVTGKIKVI